MANNTMHKLIKGIQEKRNVHLEKWIKKHLEMLPLDTDAVESLRRFNDKGSHTERELKEFFKRNYGIEFTMKSVNACNDTEEHRMFIHGKQIGTTLFIRHDMVSDMRVELHIREEIAPI